MENRRLCGKSSNDVQLVNMGRVNHRSPVYYILYRELAWTKRPKEKEQCWLDKTLEHTYYCINIIIQ